MYVKFLEQMSDKYDVSSEYSDDAVTSAHRDTIFEAREVRYSKIIKGSEAESLFTAGLKARMILNKEPKTGEEFLFVEVEPKAGSYEDGRILSTIIAKNCVMFLMNDEGKTIDSVRCR